MATDVFPALQSQEFMNLTTFRKNGEPVVTTVWFAQQGERLYVMTQADAGKIKRIRNNGRVEVGPSDRRGTVLGPTELAQARVLNDAEGEQANQLLNDKYGIQKRLFDAAGAVTRSKRAFIEVVPVAEKSV